MFFIYYDLNIFCLKIRDLNKKKKQRLQKNKIIIKKKEESLLIIIETIEKGE
jgi:hypothetical protein